MIRLPLLALFFALSCGLLLPKASLAAAENPAPPAVDTYFPFLDDATVSGGLYYFQRYRDRYSIADHRYERNLRHASGQISAEFNSGWLADMIGLDVGVYASLDFEQRSVSSDHEMNFVPWSDPWHPDWSSNRTDDGFSFYKAQLRVKTDYVQLKGGWFQPSGPGVLGVNWAFLPGTYLGAEAVSSFRALTVAAAIATEYKAPWYPETYHFLKNDAATRVDFLWSVGARLDLLEDALSLELAYGESEGFLKNAHFKGRYAWQWEGSALALSYHLYAMADSDNSGVNDNFDGVATHHFLGARYENGPWTVRLEGTYTYAPQENTTNKGYFAYRLVTPNGGAKGAYEAWWDLRSDWSHHNEAAVFAQVSRTAADFGLPGLFAAVSFAYGWGGKSIETSTRLEEYAFGFDIGYTVQEGHFAGSSLKLHYTDYRNRTHLPSWQAFQNAFQDERDIKILLTIPF